MKPWQEFLDKPSEKLLDAANILFGALIVGQFLGEKKFDWGIAVLGLGGWIALVIISFSIIKLKGGE